MALLVCCQWLCILRRIIITAHTIYLPHGHANASVKTAPDGTLQWRSRLAHGVDSQNAPHPSSALINACLFLTVIFHVFIAVRQAVTVDAVLFARSPVTWSSSPDIGPLGSHFE